MAVCYINISTVPNPCVRVRSKAYAYMQLCTSYVRFLRLGSIGLVGVSSVGKGGVPS